MPAPNALRAYRRGRRAYGSPFATRLTALRLNGMDYSPYIATWFGTDRLGANAAMEAPLRAAGRRPEISTSNSKA